MGDSIGLEIRDRRTGTVELRTVGLPVHFGKSPSGDNTVRFPSERDTISRQHGRLHREAGLLLYTDTSSNGSLVAGERIQNASLPVSTGQVIGIEDFEIRVIPSQDIVLKLTDGALALLGETVVAPGSRVAFVHENGVSSFRDILEGQTGQVEDQVGLCFSFDGTRLCLEAGDQADVSEVLVNNRNVSLPAKVSSGDVLLVDGNRIEVLSRGHDKIVCGNPDCRLLNDLPFEENCVWCGYYLAASGSFTRVTPP
jgi:hypothetical protein